MEGRRLGGSPAGFPHTGSSVKSVSRGFYTQKDGLRVYLGGVLCIDRVILCIGGGGETGKRLFPYGRGRYLSEPVLDAEPGDGAEVPDVIGDHDEIAGQSMGRDKRVEIADGAAGSREVRGKAAEA